MIASPDTTAYYQKQSGLPWKLVMAQPFVEISNRSF